MHDVSELQKKLIEQFQLQVKRGAEVTGDEKGGIISLWFQIENRELDAYKWLSTAIDTTGRKAEGKRNIAYMVGMIRQWFINGFQHMPMTDEEELMQLIERQFGTMLSQDARKMILKTMGEYGTTKIVLTVSEFAPMDISEFYTTQLIEEMHRKYKK